MYRISEPKKQNYGTNEDYYNDILREDNLGIEKQDRVLRRAYPDESQQFATTIILRLANILYSYEEYNEEFLLEQIRRLLPYYRDYSRRENKLSLKEFIDHLFFDISIATDMVTSSNRTITGWTIEAAKEKAKLVDFLGPIRKTLPININVDDKSFLCNCTEEYFAGIVISTSYTGRFTFAYADALNIKNVEPLAIRPSEILNNYVIRDGSVKILRQNPGIGQYTAKLKITSNIETITFNTPDFTEGFTFGCRWINVNPNEVIFDVKTNSN